MVETCCCCLSSLPFLLLLLIPPHTIPDVSHINPFDGRAEFDPSGIVLSKVLMQYFTLPGLFHMESMEWRVESTNGRWIPWIVRWIPWNPYGMSS
jgi:hypothetical protein